MSEKKTNFFEDMLKIFISEMTILKIVFFEFKEHKVDAEKINGSEIYFYQL